MNRDQDDDLQTLRRMLPVPAEREFPAGRRHQREEHLMTSWLTMSRRNDKRRNPAVRIALPAGLAAAAAAVALTALPAQTAAAYTLQTADDGTVKLTIVNPAGRIDLDGLQKDLDRLGVRSRIYAGDPDCQAALPGQADPSPSASAGAAPEASPSASASPSPGAGDQGWGIDREDGRLVLSVSPGKMPAGKQLRIVFPLAKTDPAHAAGILTGQLADGPGPDCVPAPPAGSVVFPGQQKR
ncbi:hypothetical protein ACIGZJ_14805 [Kitasatospora sp. NPDC052868]|uniref:hypothetical protein n=1 Tax=Kitasatospora sp. NPDC052868 TaxID=3364060 RepID=UPI0037CC04FD